MRKVLQKVVLGCLLVVSNLIPVENATSGLKPEVQKALELAEVYYGSPIFVTSAYRTPEWNKVVGGVPGSYHLTGEAIDVRMPPNNTQLAKLIWAMSRAGFTGFGLYSTHCHFDWRKNETFWRG